MRGQKRPISERARAVGIAVATGNISEAARQTGISESTIRQWYDRPEFAELRERNKDEVAAEWWGSVQKAFRRATELLDHTDDPVKAATTGAIIFDKMSLSRGEATSRTEAKNITDDLPSDVRRKLRQRFADLTSDPGDGVASQSEQGSETPAG